MENAKQLLIKKTGPSAVFQGSSHLARLSKCEIIFFAEDRVRIIVLRAESFLYSSVYLRDSGLECRCVQWRLFLFLPVRQEPRYNGSSMSIPRTCNLPVFQFVYYYLRVTPPCDISILCFRKVKYRLVR